MRVHGPTSSPPGVLAEHGIAATLLVAAGGSLAVVAAVLASLFP